MTLLVLGADSEVRSKIANKLESDGVVVRTAAVGSEAGAVLAESPWNAFLMAVERPDGQIPSLEEIERRHIELVLAETRFNMSRAARILEIDRTTLYNKLKKYGFRRNPRAESAVAS
jgi:DNA-binding NtrC family response regulator